MILTTLGALLLLVQAPLAPVRPQQDVQSTGATIQGVVLRAGSGEPLSRAQVTLVRAAAGTGASSTGRVTPSSPSASPSVLTGADGKFALTNVEAGSYRIAVVRNGYARQEYGQGVFGAQGRVITLAAGQTLTGIAFQLTPAGSVSGVVKDAVGESLAGGLVQLLRPTYGADGQRTLQAVGGDRTNDRGEYRLYWITPGRYYVAVNGAAAGRGVPLISGAGSLNEIVDRRYSTSFHPGTTDLSLATVVDVQPGAELTSIDIVVPEQDTFRVRGRIVDPAGQRSSETVSVSIVMRGATASPIAVGATPSYNPVDGTFELRDVPPGAYWLRATAAANSADSVVPSSAAGRTLADVFVDSLFSERRVAQVALDVFNDIDGLTVTLGSGIPIRGLVSVEGQPLSSVGDVTRLEVILKPAATGMLTNPSRHRPIRADGVFTLENVLPGEYVVTVASLPSGYYVKDVRLEQVDAFERPMVLSGPVAGTLSIVLSPKAGQIEGSVADDRGRPVSGIQAVLVPIRRPARVDLYRTAVTDPSGRFTIRGIPPGDYNVFAWEAIESFGYFDEELLRQSGSSGTLVRILESSRQQADVMLIRAPLSPAEP
jgi:hypothetical protein